MKKHISIFISFIMLNALLPLSAYAWPVPDSGQTKCYNDTAEIPCPSPGEDFYGQDGNYLINPPSYTKLNADGGIWAEGDPPHVMVRDNITGLIWEVKTEDGSVNDKDNIYTWDDSNYFTDQLCVGDYCDWRLPTVKELASIVKLGAYSPAIDTEYFPETVSSDYWSSAIYASSTIRVWGVNFNYGDGNHFMKSDVRYVRAVSGGQVQSFDSFIIINDDGTVSDIRTGLMWQQNKGGTKTWKDSLAYCESLTLAGYSDWRLPTREELRSLADYEKYNPAIDTSVFPDAVSSYYWSSTTDANYTYSAWGINFSSGDDYSTLKIYSRDVRAVRNFIKCDAVAVFEVDGNKSNLFEVYFDTTGSNGTLSFDFGDGSTGDGSTGTGISHYYLQSGTYAVKLTATGTGGCTSEAIINVAVPIYSSDTTPPTAPTLKSSSPSVNTWTNGSTVTVSWNAGTDSGSGVAGYSYVFDTSASTVPDNTVETAQTQITSPALADGSSHYFHIRTVDNAGNASTTLHIGPFKTDTVPPTGTISISSGASSTDSPNVTLSISAADSGSGLSQMKFSNDNVNWSSPVTYSTSAAWTLTSGEGLKTVYVRFSDAAGNWTAAAISDQITLAFSVTYPPDPEGLTHTSASDGKVSLKWDYIPSPSGVTYNLYRSETENGIFYPINSEHIDISYLSYGKIVYADTVPDMEKTYFYKVRSVLNGVESQNFSNIVSASPVSPCHFECRLITDPSLMLNRGSTVRFYFQLLPAQSFTGTLNLSCEGLPYGISYTFYTDGTAQGASLSGLIPPASVILEITAGTLTPTGDMPFTLLMQNVWNSGSSPFKKIPLNLTILPVNEEGIYAEVGETEIPFGTPAEIYGAILPPLSGRTVTLNLENLDTGSLLTRNLSTGTGGNFSDTQWISTLDMGTYEISAQWRDDNSDLQVSEFRYFTVEKGRPVLTCLRESSQLPSVDEDYTVSGKLRPTLAYEPVKLLFFREGTRMSEYTVYTDGDGAYQITGSFFPQSGIWKVKAYWMGNDRYTGCESGFLELPVDTDSGRILMLAGGQAEQGNSYWDLTEKLTVRAYRDFKSCGYTNDMIWYMINSQMIDINYDKIPDPVVDDSVPSPDDFVHALENQYAGVLDSRTPLFVFLQGHGFRDEKFEVLNNVYLTASQIAGAINTLQTAAGCPVVFILESCYSGNFIPVLSGQNRVILTSAGNEIYNTDISGRISFSRYLFSKLREGDNLKKAFDTARKEMISLGYPSPQLDDNGDRKPDTSDGLLASRIYLGGTLSWGQRPEIGEVSLPSLLAKGTSTAFLSAEVHMGQANLQRVWAQIIPPDSDITGGDSTVTWEETELTYNPATGKYEGNLSGLYLSGIYKIILMAEDAEFETAEPKIEYIGAEGSIQPGDVNNDGKVNLADVIVVLQLLCNKQTGEISKEAAIGNDKKIGLEEAVFVLRKTAGL